MIISVFIVTVLWYVGSRVYYEYYTRKMHDIMAMEEAFNKNNITISENEQAMLDDKFDKYFRNVYYITATKGSVWLRRLKNFTIYVGLILVVYMIIGV